jgi:hypothetical protein
MRWIPVAAAVFVVVVVVAVVVVVVVVVIIICCLFSRLAAEAPALSHGIVHVFQEQPTDTELAALWNDLRLPTTTQVGRGDGIDLVFSFLFFIFHSVLFLAHAVF